MATSDREQISDVLIRYATGIDTRDWDLFRTCFTPDVEADYGEIGVWHGVESITDYMETTHRAMASTNHLITNFAINQRADEASVTSYVHAVLALTDDPPTWVDAVGTYADQFVRTPNGWRIRARTFRMTRAISS